MKCCSPTPLKYLPRKLYDFFAMRHCIGMFRQRLAAGYLRITRGRPWALNCLSLSKADLRRFPIKKWKLRHFDAAPFESLCSKSNWFLKSVDLIRCVKSGTTFGQSLPRVPLSRAITGLVAAGKNCGMKTTCGSSSCATMVRQYLLRHL